MQIVSEIIDIRLRVCESVSDILPLFRLLVLPTHRRRTILYTSPPSECVSTGAFLTKGTIFFLPLLISFRTDPESHGERQVYVLPRQPCHIHTQYELPNRHNTGFLLFDTPSSQLRPNFTKYFAVLCSFPFVSQSSAQAESVRKYGDTPPAF